MIASAVAAQVATAAPDQVVARSAAAFPYSGLTGSEEKVLTADNTIIGRAFDAAGQPLDIRAAIAANLDAKRKQFGALHPDLARAIARLKPATTVPVAIWLAEAAQPLGERPAATAALSSAQVDGILARVSKVRAARVAALERPILALLDAQGIKAESSSTTSPVVNARVPVSLLRELTGNASIDTIYLQAERGGPEQNLSRQIIGATTAPAAGLTGNGVQVGIVESGGGADATNPWLTLERQESAATCTGATAHATGVAGIVVAQSGLRVVFRGIFPRFLSSALEGVVPAARVLVGAQCSTAEAETRAGAAADWGARVINNSYFTGTTGSVTASDRSFDGLVHNRWRTIVKSAGNRGTGDGRVTSPGLGYNVTAVGNVDTGGTAAFGDDVMAPTSSFVDPPSTHSDREKPELAAPGSSIQMLSSGDPWSGQTNSGTSFAAPMVTGAAARLIQRAPGLGVWPEQIRAIQMASAIRNVEGAARLSESDGAGMIAVDRSIGIVDAGTRGGEAVTCSTFPASKTLTTVALLRGQRLRTAISWTADPSDPNYDNAPSTDLDLVVSGPSQTAASASWDNTSEIVDMTATETGQFQVRVVKFRCDRDTFVGWARLIP